MEMTLLYRPVGSIGMCEPGWWPNAFHVFDGDKRIGIVHGKMVRVFHPDKATTMRWSWFAHNVNFFTIKGEFATRTEAAQAIPRGPIHQNVTAFS